MVEELHSLETEDLDSVEAENDKFPLGLVVAISSAVFCTAFGLCLYFPILPFMVDFWLPDVAAADIGFYSGLLNGCFFMGSILASIPWSLAADRFGRVNCILSSAAIQVCIITWFGFCKSYPEAIVARTLWGMTDGNIFLARSLLGDVVPSRHQPKAFSAIGICFGIGGFLGPAIGGGFAQHCDKYGWNFLCGYPFSIPTLFAIVSNTLCFLVLYCFVSEPQQTLQRQATFDQHGKLSTWQVSKLPSVRAVVTLFCFHQLVNIATNAILPLWLLLPTDEYGFDWGTTEVGFFMASAAIVTVPFQLYTYPWLANKYGIKRTQLVFIIISIISNFLYPFMVFARNYNVLSWILLIIIRMIEAPMGSAANSCTLMMVNCVNHQYQPRVNAMAQVAVSCGRLSGPILFSALFAIMANQDFPLHPFTAFILLSFILFIPVYCNLIIDESIDPLYSRKKEQEV